MLSSETSPPGRACRRPRAIGERAARGRRPAGERDAELAQRLHRGPALVQRVRAHVEEKARVVARARTTAGLRHALEERHPRARARCERRRRETGDSATHHRNPCSARHLDLPRAETSARPIHARAARFVTRPRRARAGRRWRTFLPGRALREAAGIAPSSDRAPRARPGRARAAFPSAAGPRARERRTRNPRRTDRRPSFASWCSEIVTVSRACAVESQAESAASVRYSTGHTTSGQRVRMRSRISRKQSGPAAAGTEYSISLKRSSRTDGRMRALQSMRWPFSPATDSDGASVARSAFCSA